MALWAAQLSVHVSHLQPLWHALPDGQLWLPLSGCILYLVALLIVERSGGLLWLHQQ